MRHAVPTVASFLFAILFCSANASEPVKPKPGTANKVTEKPQPPTAELVEICTLHSKKPPICRFAGNKDSQAFSITDKDSIAPDAPTAAAPACPWLLGGTDSSSKSVPMDAAGIANLLGSPFPFAAFPQGDSLLIYRISDRPSPWDTATLNRINQEIFSLYYDVKATPTPKSFEVVFQVPHSAALGDLATQIQSLNFPNFTIQDVGKDMVRVTAASGLPGCDMWASFVDALHRIVWSVHPDSPVSRVYFHAASDVSNALAGSNAPGTPVVLAGPAASGGLGVGSSGVGSSGSGGAQGSSSSATPAASGSGGSGTGGTSNGPGSSTTPGSSATSASSTGSTGATISISQSAGTATSLSMVTTSPGGSGLPSTSTKLSGGTTGTASGGAGASASVGASTGGSSSSANSATAKPAVTQVALGLSDLIFSDTTNGDDAAITERKRIVAAVDLPRPEMLINTWILQQSTSDPKLNQNIVDDLRRAVDLQNDGLQRSILAGWTYLMNQMKHPRDYFDLAFYNYVVPPVRFSPSVYAPMPGAPTAGEIVARALRDEDVLRSSGTGIFDARPYGRENDGPLNECPPDRYCLGYTTIFQPLQPSLTTMLLALISSKDPVTQVDGAIDSTEESFLQSGTDCHCGDQIKQTAPHLRKFKGEENPSREHDSDVSEDKESKVRHTQEWKSLIESIRYSLGMDDKADDSPVDAPNLDLHLRGEADCSRADQNAILMNMYRGNEQPAFLMECFRRSIVNAACMDRLCSCPPIGQNATGQQPSKCCIGSTCAARPPGPASPSISQARAAIADFLFHYKMSQQYPHDFNPYDLTQSADAMNKALRPFIDEFNKDLSAYQLISQYLMEAKTDKKRGVWYGNGKGRFNYNALVSVHTLSGSEAIVDTTTESYVDTMSMPTLSGLLNSINGALPSGGGGGGGGGNGSSTTTSTSVVNGATTTSTSTTQPVVPTAKPATPQGILSNLSLNQAQVLAGTIGAFQSTPAHIGRETMVDVLPESLSGASSAELQVGLHSADSASPPSFVLGSTGGTSDPQISRFSNSSISTRIRVDSVKMFEVASFSSELYYARKNVPLIPIPLVQLPYIGSILSVPIPPAREYHSNIAVMSAIIIPTATDLATGLRFVSDRLVEPPPLAQKLGCFWPPYSGRAPDRAYPQLCKLRPAISLADFADQPIREFHRRMIHCLATGLTAADSNLLPENDVTGRAECANPTFSEVPADAY